MTPFGDYWWVAPDPARCCQCGRCAQWRKRPVQLYRDFTQMVCLSWSPAEIERLRLAARSAFL
jgi:hypothetical protein